MAAPRSASGIGAPTQHTACVDCGIRLVTKWHYDRNMSAAEKAHRGTGFGIHGGRGLCEKCARRARRGGQVNNPPGSEVACPRCGRTTVSRYAWRNASADERAKIRAAGKIARQRRDGTCTSCDSAQRDGRDRAEAVEPFEPVAYEGGWVNRGGVLYPTAPARPTGRPPKPLIMPPADRYAGYAAYRRGDRSQWAIQGYREYQRHDQRLRRARKKAA